MIDLGLIPHIVSISNHIVAFVNVRLIHVIIIILHITFSLGFEGSLDPSALLGCCFVPES